MIQVDEQRTRAALAWEPLVEALRTIFREGCEAPPRQQLFIDVPGEPQAKFLLMPAWRVGEYIAVKLVNVFPGNAERGMPSVNGAVVLFSGRTGEVLAQIDGGELTARRTAAASALAADYLARKDSRHLVMVGTGRLAHNLIPAHATVRPIERVTVWGRTPAKATALAEEMSAAGIAAAATEDLEGAVREADVISAATLAVDPLILGEWLRPGVHVDLVGSFNPGVREADDEVIRRATVFCDTREGAPTTSGDLVKPIEAGILEVADIVDLYDLTRGRHPGRTSDDEITVFKSVGASLEDFAAAVLVYERVTSRGQA
jgi:ornithine cyclodeaminase